ncbi:alpha/beta hydrolase [Kitasatospora sp. NPDC056446]|uniref:alpha/beta hydrolase n=1 Tax=Kitasatospora sp. NPDC056446 TaxID=3345819 RepID=UPI003693001C
MPRPRGPLDYTRPAGDVLDVALVRYPAARREQRIGSLLVDPGGPGDSVTATATATAGSPTPILVVGSTADPATPYAGAQRLTAELGNAVLLTRDGDGHTAYGHSSCIRAAAEAYLTEGAVPAAGMYCSSI